MCHFVNICSCLFGIDVDIHRISMFFFRFFGKTRRFRNTLFAEHVYICKRESAQTVFGA